LLLLLGIKTIKTSITCFRRSMPRAWEDVARDTMLKRLELNPPSRRRQQYIRIDSLPPVNS